MIWVILNKAVLQMKMQYLMGGRADVCAWWNRVYQYGRRRYLSWTAERIAEVTSSPNSQGSRRLVILAECPLKNGWRAPAWYQRTRSSGSGSCTKPPTSATHTYKIIFNQWFWTLCLFSKNIYNSKVWGQNFFLCFWNKSLMLTNAAFWPNVQ